MHSSTVENYVKQLYLEEKSTNGQMVSMGRLATVMNVVPGTATSMVKALSDSGLVEYEPRTGVRLTNNGRHLALHVLRRHRLVESFLVEVLGLDWTVVHEEAETLEHVISDRVLERIDAILGHPTADPHGDPIPNPKGHVHEPRRQSLADCPTGVTMKIARVLDQAVGFLQFAEKSGLIPGALITVESREPAAEAVWVRVHAKSSVSLGVVAAARFLVEPVGRGT